MVKTFQLLQNIAAYLLTSKNEQGHLKTTAEVPTLFLDTAESAGSPL